MVFNKWGKIWSTSSNVDATGQLSFLKKWLTHYATFICWNSLVKPSWEWTWWLPKSPYKFLKDRDNLWFSTVLAAEKNQICNLEMSWKFFINICKNKDPLFTHNNNWVWHNDCLSLCAPDQSVKSLALLAANLLFVSSKLYISQNYCCVSIVKKDNWIMKVSYDYELVTSLYT